MIWAAELGLLATSRWRGDLRGRLGLRVPAVEPGSLWVHAASLGEQVVARRIVRILPPAFSTADTLAGLVHADGARPLDHPWTLAPLWAEARPRAVVFVEGSWWPGLVRLARSAGVPVVVVGARPSRGKALLHNLTGWPDLVLPRDEAAARFYRGRCRVAEPVGLLKRGSPGPAPLAFAGDRIVGICTHPGEEEALIGAWRREAPRTTLLVAPRRLERIPALRSRYGGVLRSALSDRVPAGELVWLDTFGELARLLPGARCAFVGGTFDASIGGHSPLEALHAGVPVFHGPEIGANRPAFEGTTAIASLQDLGRGIQATWGQMGVPPPDRLDLVRRELAGFRRPAPEASPRPWARVLTPAQRAKLHRRRRKSNRPRPVVLTVGSNNARGAGKTTLAAFLAEGLAARGLRVGVLTRGIGATVPGGDSAIHGPSAVHLGDEGARLALRGLRVVSGPCAEGLVRLRDVDVIVLEDGLQTGLGRFAVGIVDARFPTARGPFPAGEDRGTVRPVDLEVWVRVDDRFPAPEDGLHGVFIDEPWNREPPGPGPAFASLARASDFFRTIEPSKTRRFPNHHRYTRADRDDLLRWADGRPLLTTTRDAVRLPGFPVHHRDVSLAIPGFPWDAVLGGLDREPA